MNITGNHDIGYAGELNVERLERWESHFGRSNYVYTFTYPGIPLPLRIVLFNTLNLDSPATDSGLQSATHNFLRSLLPDTTERIPPTVLLTHLPLFKSAGICSDGPHFEYWSLNVTDESGNVTDVFMPIKDQNHLSRWASDWILETVFGDHDEGIILNGHDHEGCNVLHQRVSDDDMEIRWGIGGVLRHDELRKRQPPITVEKGNETTDWEEEGDARVEVTEVQTEENFDFGYEDVRHELELSQEQAHLRNNMSSGIWKAEKYTSHMSGIREITVRSMMGNYHGNVGLLTADYNPSENCT